MEDLYIIVLSWFLFAIVVLAAIGYVIYLITTLNEEDSNPEGKDNPYYGEDTWI